jgi:ribosomal protein S27AE
MSLVGHDTQMTCPHCGAAVSTYPAPEWLTEMLPYVMQLAAADREDGEPADATAAVAEQEAHKPVMLTCPNCSGALSVTAESQRVLPCGYCGAEVFLPDAIWQRLHPAQTVRPWTLFYAYQGPDILWTADKIAEREARLEEGRRRYREQLAREAEQKRIKKKNLVGSLLFLGVSIAVPIIILVLPRC